MSGKSPGVKKGDRRSGIWWFIGQFPVERGQADTEQFRRLLLVAAGLGQDAIDVGQFLLAKKILQRPKARRRGGASGGLGLHHGGAGERIDGFVGREAFRRRAS